MTERRDLLEPVRREVPAPGLADLIDRRDRRARRARVSAMATALLLTVMVLGGAYLALDGLGDGRTPTTRGPAAGGPPQNGSIAFTVREQGAAHVAVVSPDGSGRVVLTRSERDSNPSWSPDGTMIAYDSGLHGGLWVMAADGSGRRALTTNNDMFPSWSPDGTQIAFTRYGVDMTANMPASDAGTHLWIIGVDGTGERQLTDGNSVELSGSWSPDGTMIAFFRVGSTGGDAGIWVVNADGSNARQVATLPDDFTGNPSWSPDGTQIAYSRNTFVAGGWLPRIWVVNADGSSDHLLLNGKGTDPAWSPDGSRIAYSSNGDIWTVGVEGSDPFQVTFNPDEEILPAWGAQP
jgi:Tol biopolymer transport system component